VQSGRFIVQREPDDILPLRLGLRLRRVLGKAVERHKAAVLGLQPSGPVGDWRATVPWLRWHAPAHQAHLASGFRVADNES
jgi:hypothetical protein